MSDQQFQSLIEKGFDKKKVDDWTGVMFLLSTMLNNYNQNLYEYLKEFKIHHSFYNDIKQIENCCNRFEQRFRHTIRRDDGTRQLYVNFGDLEQLIENFLNQ